MYFPTDYQVVYLGFLRKTAERYGLMRRTDVTALVESALPDDMPVCLAPGWVAAGRIYEAEMN